MPGQFLTPADRERLSNFPADISANDLAVYFTLSADDQEIIGRQREPHTRLGFALMLCALRYLGFFAVARTRAPDSAIEYLVDQLHLSPDALNAYGGRAETRWEQLPLVMGHLGFQRVGPPEREALTQWLAERAMERDRASLLFQQACDRLYKDRLVRPAVTTLERMVIAARERAQRETYERVAAPLPKAERDSLKNLLSPHLDLGAVPLLWLRREATDYTAVEILATLRKLVYARQWPVESWPLNTLTPNRLKTLAGMAKRSGIQALERMTPQRRVPALMAFLGHSRERLTDEAVDLFDRCFQQALRRSKQDLKEYQHTVAEATQEKIRYFHHIAGILLDPQIPDAEVRSTIYRRIPPERLQSAFEDAGRLIRPTHDHYLDFLSNRYSYFRQFAPMLLDTLVFRSGEENDPLLAAIHTLRLLNAQARPVSVLDLDIPLSFVPPRWRPYVFQADGRISRRYYELCVLSELRDGLRSGAVWVEGSGRYRALETYFIPQDRWPALRVEFCQIVGTSSNGEDRLNQREAELNERCALLERRLPDDDYVRIENRQLVLTPLEADPERVSADRLSERISQLMPRVQIAELLHEVDLWGNFTQYFEHAGGSRAGHEQLPRLLYAAILAQACNIDLSRMAELADLAYHDLLWCTTWYVREETLHAATNALVNFQYQHPLSRFWGDGTFSSSDGQRFLVTRGSPEATPLPRYFGFGRGLTFLTWTSDQSSQYGIRVSPPTIREATLVLDEILDNETVLPIHQHTTDTGGSTDLLFALFDLLGLQFSPRLRDLADFSLYRFDRSHRYANLQPLFSQHHLRRPFLLDHWDEMLRAAASLKFGWLPASLLITRLLSFPRQHPLTAALQQYGRLIRTNFILEYLESERYRRRILVQTNKGEAVHRLRRFLMFGNLGQLRRNQPEDQLHQAYCLHLPSNAVVVWNTVYMQLAIDHLLAQGYPVLDTDLTHLSPTRYEHLNVYGKFLFDISVPLTELGLRPLQLSRRP